MFAFVDYLFGSLFVGIHVLFTEDTIVEREVKPVPHTESILTDLAGKALQVVVVVPRSHHHFKGRDRLVACGTHSCGSEHPVAGGSVKGVNKSCSKTLVIISNAKHRKSSV